jgi:hypothetical protein
MAGYVAMGRIERAAPRVRPAHGSVTQHVEVGATSGPSILAEVPDATQHAQIQDLAGAGFASDLLDLVADIRQVWRQGLEVLADPQGWRS